MEMQNPIAAEVYCEYYEVEFSFIQALEQLGLLSTTVIDEKIYLQPEQLPELEKYTRLHYDLDINLEGIETISHLLGQVQHLQKQVMQLRNKLAVYEM
jgi:chaperone modulatory protein CbpM